RRRGQQTRDSDPLVHGISSCAQRRLIKNSWTLPSGVRYINVLAGVVPSRNCSDDTSIPPRSRIGPPSTPLTAPASCSDFDIAASRGGVRNALYSSLSCVRSILPSRIWL